MYLLQQPCMKKWSEVTGNATSGRQGLLKRGFIFNPLPLFLLPICLCEVCSQSRSANPSWLGWVVPLFFRLHQLHCGYTWDLQQHTGSCSKPPGIVLSSVLWFCYHKGPRSQSKGYHVLRRAGREKYPQAQDFVSGSLWSRPPWENTETPPHHFLCLDFLAAAGCPASRKASP